MNLWFLALLSGCGDPVPEAPTKEEETGVETKTDSGLGETEPIPFESVI